MKQDNIRNFAIIAHVDHGKSTLADRLLELTKTIEKGKVPEQFLDQNPISRERGITIKLAPVRMFYDLQSTIYTLNLIDTPGHVDFSYEVSRTLAACEGAILLVDATQGIQAQTVAHYQQAKKQNLTIIPVINKIDLPNAQTEKVSYELVDAFGFLKEDVLYISAKTGERVQELLATVINKLPCPKGQEEKPLRALIFDAVYDEYRGVIAYIKVVDGKLKKGDSIMLFQNKREADVTEIGYFTPFLKSSDELSTGEIGYVITGIKDIRQCRVGDTIMHKDNTSNPLPGYKTPKPMVFFGVYPKSTDDYGKLKESLGKLVLNDAALTYAEEYSAYLGSGFRVGFLGLLHADIVRQRIQREYHLDLLLTMPQVLYQEDEKDGMLEPYMQLEVYVPPLYVGAVVSLCQKKKGTMINLLYHETYAVLTYEMPYSMFIRGLSADLKSVSEGYASVDYELIEYRKAVLSHLEVRINDNPIDILSELVYKDEAAYVARSKCEKLKESLPRQQFRQVIQGVVDGVIIAREEVPPFRKDVLSKMSGGDRTRKDKLIKKQKKGKSRLLSHAKVAIPQEALFSFIER